MGIKSTEAVDNHLINRRLDACDSLSLFYAPKLSYSLFDALRWLSVANVSLTHCGQMESKMMVDIHSGNGLLPVSIKPLPDPVKSDPYLKASIC